MLSGMGALRLLGRRGKLALLATLMFAACSSAAPSEAQTPPDTSRETDMAGFVLTSPSFGEGAAIPVKHACDGEDVSPALAWLGAPQGTVSFSLIVDDPDARGFIHWVVFDIRGGSTGSLPEDVRSMDAPPQGRNDFGNKGYGGPCPPGGTHRYRFTIYALSGRLNLAGTPSAAEVRTAASKLVLAQTTLTATYTRQR
jgi:Raf kinase inhibitor-like YbhB/YbcL family protein